jgi:hypothetical protein
MATQESMAVRANAACDRIEAVLAALGAETAPLPRLMREREMLRCVQLERIADALEKVPVTAHPVITQKRAKVSRRP